jgi:hypothetical protein
VGGPGANAAEAAGYEEALCHLSIMADGIEWCKPPVATVEHELRQGDAQDHVLEQRPPVDLVVAEQRASSILFYLRGGHKQVKGANSCPIFLA